MQQAGAVHAFRRVRPPYDMAARMGQEWDRGALSRKPMQKAQIDDAAIIHQLASTFRDLDDLT